MVRGIGKVPKLSTDGPVLVNPIPILSSAVIFPRISVAETLTV